MEVVNSNPYTRYDVPIMFILIGLWVWMPLVFILGNNTIFKIVRDTFKLVKEEHPLSDIKDNNYSTDNMAIPALGDY